jgi:hypothetical protein
MSVRGRFSTNRMIKYPQIFSVRSHLHFCVFLYAKRATNCRCGLGSDPGGLAAWLNSSGSASTRLDERKPGTRWPISRWFADGARLFFIFWNIPDGSGFRGMLKALSRCRGKIKNPAQYFYTRTIYSQTCLNPYLP